MSVERALTWFLRAYVGVIFVFVFTPIVFQLVFSFNSRRFPTVPLGELHDALVRDHPRRPGGLAGGSHSASSSRPAPRLLSTIAGLLHGVYRLPLTGSGSRARIWRSSCCRPRIPLDHHGAGHAGLVFAAGASGTSGRHHRRAYGSDRALRHGDHPAAPATDGREPGGRGVEPWRLGMAAMRQRGDAVLQARRSSRPVPVRSRLVSMSFIVPGSCRV
jgi:hypothetical protein